MKTFKVLNRRILSMAVVAVFALTACNKDKDSGGDMNSGILNVSDQMISQNTVNVSSVTFDQDGWIVIHADDGGSPKVPGIISEPVMVTSGTHSNIKVPLVEGTELNDGDKVWVMLHNDTGTSGDYEFDGTDQSDDQPVKNDMGDIVMKAITVSSPSVSVSNQPVSSNMVMIDNVDAAVDGWLVIHNDDGDGNITLPGIIGKAWVTEGMNSNVMVQLDSMVQISPGQKLFAMLHVDDPANNEYEFPENGDAPEVFGYNGTEANIIVKSFEVEDLTGSLDVSNQMVSQNLVMVSSITMNADGWVVVHKSTADGNVPIVPDIISEPVHLNAGTTDNVLIPVKAGTDLKDGESVYVMLHNDNGSVGTYEFDGISGFDGPIAMDGSIVMKKIKLIAPSITVSDQPVTNNKVTIDKVVLATDGWLVVHNDDGTGNITLPGILGKIYLTKGEHSDVTVDLYDQETYIPGQKLFPMIHVDSPANQIYDFPDDGDNPEVFGFDANNDPAVVVTSFMVQ
ncbi:hypothetical protein [Saccharicrinis sp. FJH54]|uniref:DUF7282 domain-containing protein n=1 Tax=Saccharicrinis sp. FJH54 TaxID=3344665 RepID=UPI0035D4C35C